MPRLPRRRRAASFRRTVDGVAGADRIFAASLDRGGHCLGSAFRSHSEIAVAILSSEGWECTASWLRWCRIPVFEGVVQRSVARRVKAEPEASLAAWLAPAGPESLRYSDASSSTELLQEFFANWWASADEADAMRQLRPGVDGVLVTAPGHRATFLPSVWDKLAEPDTFLEHLWKKSGMTPGDWPKGIEVKRYTTVEWAGIAPPG